MELSRTKKSLINITAAISLKILQIILPFIGRTLIIHKLGIAYVGLSGLFTSIIGVLSLAELGMGGALIYSMYKPVQEKDHEKICVILAFYRKAYYAIGIFMLLAGAMLSPFLNSLIKTGTYPESINIYYIYYAYLVNTVATYLVYAYKASLLDAHQLGVISSKVKIKMLIIQYLIQIILLVCTGNYYIYIMLLPIFTIISCIMIGKMADREFPNYKPHGKLNPIERRKILKNVKALFLYKIGAVVLNSVDSIIISWYLGAYVLGIYNNYYYIVSSLFSLLLAVSSAILPSVGNSIVVKSKEKNYKDFMMFSLGYSWITGWCAICLACLFQPFIEVWIGADNLLPFGCAFLFAIYFYSFRMGDVVGWYKDAAGLWQQDRYRPIISSVLNLALNIILIRYIGLYGVLLSTIITLITINYPIAVRTLLKYFNQGEKKFFLQQFYCLACITFNALITYKLCDFLPFTNAFPMLFARIIICLIAPNIIFFALFMRNESFKKFVSFVKRNLLNRV